MELEKQKLLLSYLVSSQELFTKVNTILKTTYFDPQIKQAVTFIKSYFDEYKVPPTPEQVKAETGTNVSLNQGLTKQEIAYAEKELETFCRNKAIENAIMSSPKLLAEGKFGEIEKIIRDAITVGLQRNIGLNYFHDPEVRLKNLALGLNMIPTGWNRLDHELGGGLNRKEMIIFAAPPGVGKSLTMGNLGRNLLKRGMNGVYITLELSEEVTAKRFDSMFSGIAQIDILKDITKASIEIKKQAERFGSLHIKRMPESSTNANHIRAYLKEFEIVNGFVPDFIIVDYMDLMCSVQSISAENTFVRDKFISEELRSIANDYNLVMITASQLNRSAQLVENGVEDISQAHIAGGISKVNTTDNMVAIFQSKQMKARGEMLYKLLKTRSSSGVGNTFMLKFNPKSLLLEDIDDEDGGANHSVFRKPQTEISSPATPKHDSNKPSKLSLDKIPFQI